MPSPEPQGAPPAEDVRVALEHAEAMARAMGVRWAEVSFAVVDGHVTLDTFTPRKFEDRNIVEA